MARDPYGYTGGGAFRTPSARDPAPEDGWPFGGGVRTVATAEERRAARRARAAERAASRQRYREDLRAAGERDRARRAARRSARRGRTRVGECAGDDLGPFANGVRYAIPAELGADLEAAPAQPSAGLVGTIVLGGLSVLTALALYRQHRRGGPGH